MMKRIALLLLVVALVFTLFVFTGCGGDDVDTNTDSGNVNTDTDTNNQTPEADEDLQAAYDYIKLTYKTLGTTSSNFELMKNAPIGDKIFAITWSTDNEAITITETEDGNFYVVNIPALGETAINYSLKFSIQNEAGEKKEGSFSLTIPKFAVNTFEEYAAAEDGTPLIIQGIVTGVISKSTNSTKENSLFIQDLNGNGGYYAYNLAEDPNGTISVGMTVEVRGNKKNYNGTFELTSPVATVIDSTIKTVTPVDFTETLAGAESLDDVALTGKNGMLVTIKGVTILEYVEGNGYHYFQLGDHKTYLRVSSSSNCITKEEGETLTANFQSNFYNCADVTGIIAVYNNDFYLMPVSVEPFTNIVEMEKPADVKVETALSNTTLPSIIQLAGNTELPTSFSGFSDVTIAWELVTTEGVNCATLSGSTLTVTVPTEAQVVTLKATATCGDVSDSKEFSITVKPISTITIQEANNIGDLMAHNKYTEELYYIVGTIDNIASDVYGNLYLVDGDFSIYIYGLYDATGKVRYDSMDPKPLVKDTIKVLSCVGKYSTTVQLKNAKVIEHTVHEDNVGAVTPDDYTQMTITEALAAADDTKVKVSGTVVSIDTVWNESYGNISVTIADADGNKLYLYRLSTKVEVGDIITVKGKMATYNENRQLAQGGTATIDGHDSSYDYVEMSILDALNAEDGTNVIVVGTVSKIDKPYDSNYKNISVYIADEDGNELYLYRLSGDVAVGKTIKVTGSMATYSGNRQLVGGTYEEVAGSGDTDDDNTGDVNVSGECTISEALNAEAGASVIISGTVCEIYQAWSDSYGNISVYITDAEGNKILCYRMSTKVVKGDIITVTGEIAEYNGSNQIAAGCTAEITGHDDSYDVGPAEVTIADALELADGTDVIVTGTVIRIDTAWSDSYGNISVTIKDENGDELYLYRLATNVAVHNVITVTGAMATYNSSRQIAAGATAEIIDTEECTDYADATCTSPAVCVLCGTAQEGSVALGHTPGTEATCTEDQKCTFCGEVIEEATGHNYVDGICTECGAAEGSAVEKTEVTVSKSHTDIAGIAGVTVGQNTGVIADKEIALNEDITIVCAKGNATSDPCIYSESIRLYQGGATVTVKAAEGCEMTTIVIHLATKSGGQGPITVSGGTASALSDYTYTITVEEGVSEVVITTAGTDKNNRLYVDNISVEYKK